VSTDANRRQTRYLQALAAISGLAAAASYLLAAPGPQRAGAFCGVASCALLGILALYLKRWAIERSLKSSLAIVGILFGLRLIALGVGVGLSRVLGIGAVAFAVAFLSVYFVMQWIEIAYLASARSQRAHREGA
jgi:hypothetical protein